MNLVPLALTAVVVAAVMFVLRRVVVTRIRAGKLSIRGGLLITAAVFALSPLLFLLWRPGDLGSALLSCVLLFIGGVLGVFVWLAVLQPDKSRH